MVFTLRQSSAERSRAAEILEEVLSAREQVRARVPDPIAEFTDKAIRKRDLIELLRAKATYMIILNCWEWHEL